MWFIQRAGNIVILLIVSLIIQDVSSSYIRYKTEAVDDDNDDVIVLIRQGLVRGLKEKTRGGRLFSSFKGIPYAKPPIGNLRFKDPVPILSWTGVLNATEEKSPCIQKNYLIKGAVLEGSEDCLYLNVYTPEILTGNQIAKVRYPVMVYIHGGGWFSGSGGDSTHGPEYILDENVILVTLNYRLGAFGFLTTGDDVAPGNWAFKDMTIVLEWVQENIERFGGKADAVTIFGQSAGAASVHYLMLSPRTKGLFHRAISQSGTALNLWASSINNIDITRLQAQFVNCSTDVTNNQLIECLQHVDATTLVESGDKFKFWDIDPLTVYTPSIEKKTEQNQIPFIPDQPLTLIKQGLYHPVPYMMGVVKNEGIIRAAPIASKEELRTDLNRRWNELGPTLFALSLSVPKDKIQTLWNNITEFYMGNELMDVNKEYTIENFVNLYSDRAFIYGSYQSAMLHSKNIPVYFYKFDYPSAYTFANVFAGTQTPINYVFNTSHCDDLLYLFKIPALFPEFPNDSAEVEMSKKLVKLWTTFAKESKPAKFWEPMEHTNPGFRFLNIISPTKMIMNTEFLPKRMRFWEKI